MAASRRSPRSPACATLATRSAAQISLLCMKPARCSAHATHKVADRQQPRSRLLPVVGNLRAARLHGGRDRSPGHAARASADRAATWRVFPQGQASRSRKAHHPSAGATLARRPRRRRTMTHTRPTLGLILVLAACSADPAGSRSTVEGAAVQCVDGGGSTGSGCTLTQGYWKNHEEAWPVASLDLGGGSYAQAELLALLRTAPRGDASLILAHQLIASMLNVASGAGPLPGTTQAIADAQAWMAANLPAGGRLPYGVASTSAAGAQAVQLSAALDGFNNGNAGVP